MADTRTRADPSSPGAWCLAAALAAVALACGCEGPVLRSAERTPVDFLELLARRRRPRRDFCESLSSTAPVRAGTEISSPAPFVERRAGPAGSRTWHVLWPLFSSSRSPESRSLALRPIFASESSPGRKRVTALWPLSSYTREGPNRTFRIIPIVRYTRRVRPGPERETDTDFWLFPLIFAGNDTREGRYFAILPLGGTLKGFLGRKWVAFALWPVFGAAETTTYRSVHVLWPFMGYWKGERHHGRKLWPFFEVNRLEGRFERRSYFWPLVSYWRVGLDTKRPGTALFVFPFFGRIRNVTKAPSGESTTYLDKTSVLFPFFHRVSQKRVAPTDSHRNLDAVGAPWPFLGYERGDGLVARKLWPVWGERKSNDSRRQFFLWPLWRRAIQHEMTREVRRHNFALAFNSVLERWVEDEAGRSYPPPWPGDFKRIGDERIALGLHSPYRTMPGEVRSRRWVQLWPLFHYRRHEDGRRDFQMLSLFPRTSRGRGETLWGPFLTLYRFQRDETGQKRESALLGLYRHTRRRAGGDEPGMRYVSIAWVLNYHRTTGVGKRWSLLGGLLGYERVGRHKRVKFLWIPFGRIPREARNRER